jgi:hypothetical protein
MSMARRRLTDDFTTEVIERGKKGHRPMPVVIVSDGPNMALS